MSFLDSVPDDPSPLIINLDFSGYENGPKFSTLFRAYHEKYKDIFNVPTPEEYVAYILKDRLVLQQKSDANTQVLEASIAAAREQVKSLYNELDKLEVKKL